MGAGMRWARRGICFGCLWLALGCSGGGGSVSSHATPDAIPFSGTRSYALAGLSGAGFDETTLNVEITDLAAAGRATTVTEIRVVLNSSDGRFVNTVLQVTRLTSNRIEGTATTTDGQSCSVVIEILNQGGSIRITLTFPTGTVIGTGGQGSAVGDLAFAVN